MDTKAHQVKNKHFTGYIAAAIFAAVVTSSHAAPGFQERMLLAPTESMLKAEQRGRVTIYDGLNSNLVKTAMDQHFDRIENMMFIRTQHTTETGDTEVEDDDC